MTAISNHAHADATQKLAATVGSNFKTLRDNKRKLAQSLILSVAVEGFVWTDQWAAVKKSMKFANLEKPEQNQINVFGTMCKTVVLAWSGLDKAVQDDFIAGKLLASTLATTIKDAEKARDKADGEEQSKVEAGEEASKQADPRDATPAPVADRSAMIREVASMFNVDADAATMTGDELAAMLDLVAAVDAFKAATIGKAAQAA